MEGWFSAYIFQALPKPRQKSCPTVSSSVSSSATSPRRTPRSERIRGIRTSNTRPIFPTSSTSWCPTPFGRRWIRRGRPRTFGSPTCSDWVFVREADAIKCGPGTSRRSHTPDEYVDLSEVTAARTFYARLAKEYLG